MTNRDEKKSLNPDSSNDSSCEEDDVVRRVREGDKAALAQLFESRRGQFLAALERKVGPGLRRKLELEDILQETVTRAVRDLPNVQFDGQDPVGWIYHVMDRQIVDLHRYHFEAKKRDAGREVSMDQNAQNSKDEGRGGGLADLLIASMTSPSAAVSRDMRLVRVYRALESLSEDMKNAIRWRYLENLPSQQIAERLGRTDAATRVLLSRAIRKLQDALSEAEK